MLSRVADSLYWMSRYMERADGILRMLKINYAASQDDLQDFSWAPVLKIFTTLPAALTTDLANDTRKVLALMITDRDNPNSVLNIVTQARENGRSVQDHITKEMWQCLNDFYHSIRQESLVEFLQKEDPVSVLDVLIRQGLLYFGTTDVTMSRGEGNAFISIGKYLERSIQSTDILDVKFSIVQQSWNEAADTAYWKYLLLSISGYELYLKTYRSGFNGKNTMEQIILHQGFPRSVIYCINKLEYYFTRIKNEKNMDGFKEVEFMIGKLKGRVQFSTAETIIEEGLHPYLTGIKAALLNVGSALNKNYFAHS